MARQVWHFTCATGLSASITLGIPALLKEMMGVPAEGAFAIALVMAFIVNFLVTRNVVFRSTRSMAGDFNRFALVSLLFRAGEYLCFLLLHNVLGAYYLLAIVATLATSTVLKFITYKFYVFAVRES